MTDSQPIETHADVIDALGPRDELSKETGISRHHLAQFKHRNSIPSEHWPVFVARAKRLEIKSVTLERYFDLKRGRPQAAEPLEAVE